MLKVRIIPCLDVKDGRVVKGINFVDLRDDDDERRFRSNRTNLLDDPAVSRKALLRARWGRFAADVGDEDERPRELVETWIDGALAQAARAWA